MPKSVRYVYHQHGPFCVCALTWRPFSQRRGSLCVVRVSLDQATRLFLLPCASRTGFAVDKATNDLPRGWCTRRFDQRQSRTAGRKREARATTCSSCIDRSKALCIKRKTGFCWYSSPRWFEAGKRRSSWFSRRRGSRGPRELFRVFWKHTSKARARKPKLSLETVTLIKEMVTNNRLWGAERIRGEPLKLDIRVSKRTIQRYMKQAPRKRPSGQTWKTFLRNHMAEVSGVGGL